MLPYPSPRKRVPLIAVAISNYIYSEGESTATARIAWQTPKVTLFKYNGEYFITDTDLGPADEIDESTWATLGSPLPDSNLNGETATSDVTIAGVIVGHYAYARVRIGRVSSGWGDYGYLSEVVQLASGGGGGGGEPGESAYVYIAYASDDSGADFTMVFDPDLDYIAILSTDIEIVSPIVDDFTGLWKKYGGGGGSGGITETISITDIYEALHQINVVDGAVESYTVTPAVLGIKLAFASAIQPASFNIIWITNKPSSTIVQYRIHSDPGWGVAYDSGSTYSQHHIYTIEELSPSTDYDVKIQSDIASPAESVTETLLVRTASSSTPAEPVAIAATNITAEGFQCNWYASAGAESYLLDLNTSAAFDGTAVLADEPVVDLFYIISGLDPAVTYYYRLRGVNPVGEGEYSNVVETLTLCEAPIAIDATVIGGAQFTANWNESVGAASYKIDVSTDEFFTAGTFVLGYENKTASGTSEIVTGLAELTSYYYRLRAINSSGVPSTDSSGIKADTIEYLEISSLAASGVQPYGALISWNTNKLATSVLQYRETGESAWVDYYDGAGVTFTEHSVLLTGLKMSTGYDIRAYGECSDPMESDDAAYSFVTTNVYHNIDKPTPQAYPMAAVQALANTKLVILNEAGFLFDRGTISGDAEDVLASFATASAEVTGASSIRTKEIAVLGSIFTTVTTL